MEYNKNKKEIVIKREANKLDRFVLDFARILKKHADYVIVSGYVSIVLGRTRATEDVDLLTPKIGKDEFEKLFACLEKENFECINTSKHEEALEMLKENAIRFARKNRAVPNIEFKIIKNKADEYSFKNKIRVVMGGEEINISPLEMQIAYKLFLGSPKDLEDAKHIYELFKEKLNKEELAVLIKEFRVEDKFEIIK